jgi:ribose 5-phosphate isomerase B
MPETTPIAAASAGFPLKRRFIEERRRLGYEPLDLGTHSADSADYPPIAHDLARRIAGGEAARGILMCGTGLGMSYAANRHRGVRAAVAWSPDVARLAREHNDANVLVVPSRQVPEEDALAILRAWLDTAFEGGRHARRVAAIDAEGA